MCMYVNHIQHTYAHSYAQDTAQCISDMHIVHWICTYLYLHVFDCICMYPGSLELYQVHMCMYVVHIHACIHADTYTYALPKGSAYLYVSDCISRSHTFTYASILWFLLRQIGRPQQRATRESVIIIGINDCPWFKSRFPTWTSWAGAGAVPTGERSSSQQENQSGARPAWKLQFGNHLRFVTVPESLLNLTAERRVIFRGHDCLLPCAARRASL
jgi:hypothetical protein